MVSVEVSLPGAGKAVKARVSYPEAEAIEETTATQAAKLLTGCLQEHVDFESCEARGANAADFVAKLIHETPIELETTAA
ncbi:MAG: hypothetical protein JWN38_362 [Candidatus Saccharibacteria bacterium]|nr:hypothetical protein [Candidatus Saccharibacteria bacterium]